MKVLQINSFFSQGGPPRIMNGIYDTLVENGVDCKIAAARADMRVPEDSIRIGSPLLTYKNALEARLLDNDGFSAKAATRALIKQIEEYNPDIIQLHNLHGYYINIEILFSFLKSFGKPVVWTMHDCWPLTGHCPYFTMVKCNRWQTGCYNCPLKKEYPSSILLDRSEHNWNMKKSSFSGMPNLTIVCISKWFEQTVKQSFLKDCATTVIYNGIDLSPFKFTISDFREKYGLVDKKILLGVALHWPPRKGLNDYIELAKQLDDSYRIVLVGLSENEVPDMPANIVPIPPVSDDTVLAQIYSTCDICLNLSYEETFGLTSVEALACGTPIITYDQTAVPEIAEMFGAPVVHAGDIDTLVKTIETTFANGVHKQDFDVSVFEQRKQYLEYMKLYEELCK